MTLPLALAVAARHRILQPADEEDAVAARGVVVHLVDVAVPQVIRQLVAAAVPLEPVAERPPVVVAGAAEFRRDAAADNRASGIAAFQFLPDIRRTSHDVTTRTTCRPVCSLRCS